MIGKTGLILEGGAMRGLFSCGVTDVFMENGIVFDGIAGISAGAVFGCNIKSRQPGRAIRYNMRFCRDPRYCSVLSLILTGDMYGSDFCYRRLPDELDIFDRRTYEEDPTEFYAGAFDVNRGKAVFHKCMHGDERDIMWMRASASMPIASRPVKIGSLELLDGGIIDAVPYSFMEKRGYSRNVIILTQPEGFRKKKTLILPLLKAMMRKYPLLIEAMSVRHDMYNRQMSEIKQRELDGSAIVIRPPRPLGISRTEKDPEELHRVYMIGRKTGEEYLPKVRGFLGNLPMRRRISGTGMQEG